MKVNHFHSISINKQRQRLQNQLKSLSIIAQLTVWICLISGCAVKTHRSATEQLLLSDAVDRAVAGIDFSALAGKKIFLDTSYIEKGGGQGLVNSDYVISSLRHQLTTANCQIQLQKEDAAIIVEPRIGTLSTDGHETVYGIPAAGMGRAMGAAPVAAVPLSLIPEISVGRKHAQSAIAKIIVYAYDLKTADPIWQSGIAKAESSSKDTWILGSGPFSKGGIHEGMKFAGKKLEGSPINDLQNVVKDEKLAPSRFDAPLNFSSLPKLESEHATKSNVDESVQPAGHTENK